MSRAYYIGSEVESEVMGICYYIPELRIGSTRPPNMPDEDGERILGMYLMEKDSYRPGRVVNVDICPLVDFPVT